MRVTEKIINRLRCVIKGPTVRDRVVIRVVDPSARLYSPPCFLIGVYRSGTTLLRFVLDSHSEIAVPPETNFLYDLAGIWRSEWTRKGLAGAGVDEDRLRKKLRDFSSGIMEDYAAAKGKSRWVDKTPAYTGCLDFLDFLYGTECRYIMLYRHGLDVANSLAGMYEKNVLGGPAKDYADASNQSPRIVFARYWAEQGEKMLAFEDAHPGQCHRIHYEQYSSEPEKFLPPLFDFMGEEWEPDVLRFNEKQHDFGLQDSLIADTKDFAPQTRTYLKWNRDELAAAEEAAGGTLKKLGYEV